MPYVGAVTLSSDSSAIEVLHDANARLQLLDDIAIVGLSCRFGGDAVDSDSLWSMLCESRTAYSKTGAPNGTSIDANGSPTSNRLSTHPGHYLKSNVYAFDSGFFGISNKEAKAMDPSQRIMLEVTYEAIENAGMKLADLAGTNTSCYVGQFVTDYREMLLRDPMMAPTYAATGTGTAILSNRISWIFDLRGPSSTIHTACSSSMVALHEACQSLRSGESEMAIVGGSNLILSSEMFDVLGSQSFLAKDGRCKAFDASGDGYGRGEGVAALVLKPVSRAVRDGNCIRAVIRGTGVNQNGRTDGLTMPSTEAQRMLIEKTYKHAGLTLSDTAFVEAHGTGTRLGDPRELEAIGISLGRSRGSSGKLIVGSIKPNIGHTEATAGLAAVIKGVFSLERGLIPPQLLFKIPNEDLRLDEWNISIPTTLSRWPSESLRRMSACSSGYGGTNAHVVMDDAYSYLVQRGLHDAKHNTTPPTEDATTIATMSERANALPKNTVNGVLNDKLIAKTRHRLFVLSSSDTHGLMRQAHRLAQYCIKQPAGNLLEENAILRNLAHTVGEHRSRFSFRTSYVANSLNDLSSQMAAETSKVEATRRALTKPTVAFVFTGQGAQWAQMGKELFDLYDDFRFSVEDADSYLRMNLQCPWSAVDELFCNSKESRIGEPEFSQPLCTILQVALVQLLRTWNIHPSYVAGHSSGEIAMAYSGGALTREDAWKVAYYRGVLSSRMKRYHSDLNGGMMAVGLSATAIKTLIKASKLDDLVVACVNSPESTTVSGDIDQLIQLEQSLNSNGTFARRLKTGVAYHSPHMERIARDYFHSIRHVLPQPPLDSGPRMYSAVTGVSVETWELGPLYWLNNLVSPVLFAKSMGSLLAEHRNDNTSPVDVVIEIGPHKALQGAIRQVADSISVAPTYASVIHRGSNAASTALEAAGVLFAAGTNINLSSINGEQDTDCHSSARLLVDLPPYAWDHRRALVATSRVEQHYQVQANARTQSLLGQLYPPMAALESTWRGYVDLVKHPWLRDHVIDGTILFPGAGYLILAMEAARHLTDQKIMAIRMVDIEITSALVLTEDESIETITRLCPHRSATDNGKTQWWKFAVLTCSSSAVMTEHCTGVLSTEHEIEATSFLGYEVAQDQKAAQDKNKRIQDLCRAQISAKETQAQFYSRLANLGLHYGPSFQLLDNIACASTDDGDKYCSCNVAPTPNALLGVSNLNLPSPASLDTMFHAVFAACGHMVEASVPTSIDEVVVFIDHEQRAVTNGYAGYATAKSYGLRDTVGDLDMFDPKTEQRRVHVRGLRLHPTGDGQDAYVTGNTPKSLCSQVEFQPTSIEAENFEGSLLVLRQTGQRTAPASLLSNVIVKGLSNAGVNVQSLELNETSGQLVQGKRCIALIDLDDSLLVDATNQTFQALKTLILNCSSLLWVSYNNPSAGIFAGLARVVRNEVPELTLRFMQIPLQDFEEFEMLGNVLMQVAFSKTVENEFRFQDGRLLVPRLTPQRELDDEIANIASDRRLIAKSTLETLADARILTVGNPGVLDSLVFAQHEASPGPLRDDEVEIHTVASGMNFRDVMVAMGKIPDATMGFEASGVVSLVGSNVTDIKIGDRVCVLQRGSHASTIRSARTFVQKMTDELSFETACTLPLVHATAYHALYNVAHAKPGQTILIHAAAGGVGQSAIMLAQHIGMEVFATTSSKEKRSLLREQFHLPDDHILQSRDTSFADAVMRMTKGRGVDVVLNSLSGEALRRSWQCIAPFGTFVEIGLYDIQRNSALDMRPFIQDATFSFFNLSRMMDERPEAVGELLHNTFSLLRKGILRPVYPVTEFSIADVEKAFRTMQAGRHIGKIALLWNQTDEIPAQVNARNQTRLRANASYLLVGGFGGIGRSLAHLLVDMGAETLVFLSRSGSSSATARSTLAELAQRDVHAHVVAVDIADASALQQAVVRIMRDLPPIRGVLQCAMALHDTLFERMTYDQWRQSLRPKVQGSKNLDALLPRRLDFFVLLSSFSGIFGNPSQSNYAAGCAFQDALAAQRRQRGEAAVSLDLGIVKEVGVLAETGGVGHILEWTEPFGLSESEVRALVQAAIAGILPAQLVTGLPIAREVKKAQISEPMYFADPRFSALAKDDGAGSDTLANAGARGAAQDVAAQLGSASTLGVALGTVLEALVARVARALQVSVEQIDTSRSLNAHGVDSLVAVELRSWLWQTVRAKVSSFDLTASVPMKTLAGTIVSRSEFTSEPLRS